MIDLAKRLAELLTAAGIILGAIWYVGEPRAQEFVREAVNDQIVVLQDQLKQLRDAEAKAETSQTQNASDLASLKAMQRQTEKMLEILVEKAK